MRFRVLRMQPGFLPVTSLLTNGSFEKGHRTLADRWQTKGSQPPDRIRDDARNGSFSMHCKLSNRGSAPQEGLLSQVIRDQDGKIAPDTSWVLSFWARTVSAGPSYIQQHHLAWLDESGEVLTSHPFTAFPSAIRGWRKISFTTMPPPQGTAGALLSFRFVTGAVENGHGEVYLDDVVLTPGNASAAQPPVSVASETTFTSRLSWPTKPDWVYPPFKTTIAGTRSRSSLVPTIRGDGTTASVLLTAEVSATLRAALPATLSLLPAGELSAEQSSKGQLSLRWKEHANPRATYRILHGAGRGILSGVIDTGSNASGSIANVKAGEIYSFAVLAIHPALP